MSLQENEDLRNFFTFNERKKGTWGEGGAEGGKIAEGLSFKTLKGNADVVWRLAHAASTDESGQPGQETGFRTQKVLVYAHWPPLTYIRHAAQS